MNRLFVVNKPIGRSSNGYMGHIKRKYGTKKVGFSGTLDPFASGCLIVATGQYTRLFQYLAKTPKVYRATLWLGADSPTLDIEKVTSITEVAPLDEEAIREALSHFVGELTYYPPKYSAKKIDGRRAYELMREGKDPALKSITSTIHSLDLLLYNHPFVHFEATVSEGTYIRSLGAMIADYLQVDGTLSSLQRLREGDFVYNNETPLDPFKHLKLPRNTYTGDEEWLELGKKLSVEYFAEKNDGIYLIETTNFFAIIEIMDDTVTYRLNRLAKFSS
jgi:tRNA pseudouridine55 synthase